ncbi:hypothetical protein [Bacillus sp. 2205SS5-2]
MKNGNREDPFGRMMKEIDRCSVLWSSDEHHEAVVKFMNKK